MKMLIWWMIFFSLFHAEKEYYHAKHLKSIKAVASPWKFLWWLIIGVMLWKCV